jgi:hypothetical protein
VAHNLTGAAGCLTGPWHAKARAATLRRHLINIPARIAHRARRVILHPPADWPWQQQWQALVQQRAFSAPANLTQPTPARQSLKPPPGAAGTPGRITTPTKHNIHVYQCDRYLHRNLRPHRWIQA